MFFNGPLGNKAKPFDGIKRCLNTVGDISLHRQCLKAVLEALGRIKKIHFILFAYGVCEEEPGLLSCFDNWCFSSRMCHCRPLFMILVGIRFFMLNKANCDWLLYLSVKWSIEWFLYSNKAGLLLSDWQCSII